MNNTHIHDQLDDYVDGQLPPDKHKAFEQHLQSCTMCQQELQMFNALREKISSLPQSIQPERDLWTGIESRLRTPEKPLVEGGLANRRNGKLFSLPSLPLQGIRMSTWYIRAAAIVLLLATASVLWIMLHRSAPEQQIVTRKGTEATSPRITQDTSRQQIFPPPKIVQTPGQPSEYLASRETPHGKKPLGIQPKREQPVAPATPNDSLTLITQLQQNIPPAIGPIGTGKIVGRITDKSTGVPLVGVNVLVVGTTRGSVTDIDGKYTIIGVPPGSYSIRASQVGYTQTETRDVKVAQNENTSLNFSLNTSEVAIMGVTVSAQKPVVNQMSISALQATGRSIEAIPSAKGVQDVLKLQAGIVKQGNNLFLRKGRTNGVQYLVDGIPTYSIQGKPGEKNQQGHNIGLGGEQEFNTEQYDRIYENEFLDALKNPLSTFSIDVDAASYSNIRRFINNGQFPPKDAVRIEEMINYFTYDYPQPKDKHPFSITTEVTTCPWNTSDKLLLIGLQGKKIPLENLPPSNLVFLIDVSGSMNEPNKLPLVKSAFRLLVDQLRDRDRVSIVVYAGSPGLVLPSTSGSEKATIMQAIDNLEAGGSTAGGAGIKLAYKVAKENFKKDGNNRVILATDGDFNVGVSSDGELVRIIEEQRNEGVYLSVLGFGMGNYKDSKMEKLADKGNGNYAYIDNIQEAKKVFVGQMAGTLYTIAKDVKIQIEFNPSKVKAYRLIGYEDRLLAKEDFNDDKKDAGELGSGHTVTALYEIVPADGTVDLPTIDSLKYQNVQITSDAERSNEMLTVKLRYKPPTDTTSKLMVNALKDNTEDLERASENLRFAASVAEFGMLLRDSKFKGTSTYEHVITSAKNSTGTDLQGYRAEFIRLVEACKLLSKNK